MSKNKLLYLLVLLKFILPFFLQDKAYELHRDEFLYLAEGNHLDWGYMEEPYVLSLFSWVTHWLGDNPYWVKIWTSLFGAFTYLIAGKIILSLGGSRFALLLAFFSFVFGAFLRVHFLFQPNFLEMFFCTAIAYTAIRYVQTQKSKWLYYAGVSIGFGMMSKYSVAIYVISIFIGLMLTNERKIFLTRHFYYAMLIAVIIMLPNFIWQYHRHFPVVYHMETLHQYQLQYITPERFLINQLLMNLPVVFIWLSGLIFLSFSSKAKPYRFVSWAYVSVIVILLLAHGKDYYSLGAYPVLFAFGSCRLEQLTVGRLRYLRYLFIFIPLSFAPWVVPILLPVFPPEKLAAFYTTYHLEKLGFLTWEDGNTHSLPQDFADMLGWKEMTQKVSDAYNTLNNSEKIHAIIFCDNYGQAGAVNFYGHRYHLPEAYSDNASYFYWLPKTLKFSNAVLVTDDKKEMQHPFIKDFKSAVLFDSITSPYARERGSLIIILKGGNKEFEQMFREKIEADERKYGDSEN